VVGRRHSTAIRRSGPTDVPDYASGTGDPGYYPADPVSGTGRRRRGRPGRGQARDIARCRSRASARKGPDGSQDLDRHRRRRRGGGPVRRPAGRRGRGQRGGVRRQLLAGPAGRLPELGDAAPDRRHVGTSRNFATSGATAAKVGTNHFARQLRLWREAGRPVAGRVIVFLGINDILNTDTFDASYTGYKRGIYELRTAGARLLLIEPLDLGKTPGYVGDADSAAITRKTVTWNTFVRGRGLPVVRLFDVFKPRLPNNALFHDDLHLDRDGHAIVAAAVRAKLAS
jgi:lysophospholipase L1-like esterase